MTTTAFCTVDLVTSDGRYRSKFESICLAQDMPKREVAGSVAVSFRRSVK